MAIKNKKKRQKRKKTQVENQTTG